MMKKEAIMSVKTPKIKGIAYEPSPKNGGADMEVPDFVIDTMAHCLLPQIQAFYASPEGQAAFEAWMRPQKNTQKNMAPIKDDGGRFSCADTVQINNKSEPVPNGERIRIMSVWWRLQNSNDII